MSRRVEVLALAISDMNGGLTPGTKAFRLANPGMLRTYRPEKKQDSDHVRIFSSLMGGLKALTADIQSKSSGQNHRLSPDNTLRDLLALFDMKTEPAVHKIVSFLRRGLENDILTGNTPLSWFLEKDSVEDEEK
jgi:hypothetical protein